MSISDPKVKVAERTAAHGVAEARPIRRRPAHPAAGGRTGAPPTPPPPTAPSATASSRWCSCRCDFVCACIALPLSLIVLSQLSAVPVNAPGQLLTNLQVDSLFPVAVVVALALGGVYRVTHRRLQPSAFLEMRELSFGVGCGCVLALAIGSFLHAAFGTAEPYATQLVTAVIVTIGSSPWGAWPSASSSTR